MSVIFSKRLLINHATDYTYNIVNKTKVVLQTLIQSMPLSPIVPYYRCFGTQIHEALMT